MQEIVGEQLSEVTFVHDYWQLRFDGPCLTVFSTLRVRAGDLAVAAGEDQFRNWICEQIGKVVTFVELREGDAVAITLQDGITIEASLRDDDCRGPEALMYASPLGMTLVM